MTRDAGGTWQRQRNPCTTSLGFKLGEGGAGNEEKALFRTRDGGRT